MRWAFINDFSEVNWETDPTWYRSGEDQDFGKKWRRRSQELLIGGYEEFQTCGCTVSEITLIWFDSYTAWPADTLDTID